MKEIPITPNEPLLGGCSIPPITRFLYMGLFLKAGAQFLTAVSGLQDPIHLKLIMTGLLLLVLFYTVLGGMVSVVITDLIQFFVLVLPDCWWSSVSARSASCGRCWTNCVKTNAKPPSIRRFSTRRLDVPPAARVTYAG